MEKIINSKVLFGGIEAQNRVLIQPMEGCDGTADGSPAELTKRRYMRFAESGAGVIWFEAVAVCKEGRANPRQLSINDKNVGEFKQLISDIKRVSREKFGYEPIVIMQATHSGRYSKPNGFPEPIIAYRSSVFEAGREDWAYRIITDEECDKIPEMYAKSAKLAAEVGFDGVDVKCCHGYLFDEFLSAYARAGKYGGDFEGRTRLYLSCVDSVKNSIPENMFVTTRLNAYDGFDYPYGFGVNENNELDLTETKKLISILKDKGVELVNITLGNPYMDRA